MTLIGIVATTEHKPNQYQGLLVRLEFGMGFVWLNLCCSCFPLFDDELLAIIRNEKKCMHDGGSLQKRDACTSNEVVEQVILLAVVMEPQKFVNLK